MLLSLIKLQASVGAEDGSQNFKFYNQLYRDLEIVLLTFSTLMGAINLKSLIQIPEGVSHCMLSH